MSSVSVNGAFALFFANLISKLFGGVYRLPLSNILGAEGIGLYQMAFPIYSFLLTFITGGVSITLTRKIAQMRAKGLEDEIYKQFILGKNTSLMFGFIFFVFMIVMAYPLSVLQGNVNAVYGYFAIAMGFVFASILGAYRGYYQGYGNMKPTAISQVLEQSAKLVFGLVFAGIFLRWGVLYAVFGALIGVSLSEIIAYIYFLIINKKRIKRQRVEIGKGEYKVFLKQVLPISLSYMILPLATLIDSLLVINLLRSSGFVTSFATSLYGIETGMILPLINLPNVLISAIALACIPDISYSLSEGQDVKSKISQIYKTVFIFILPCCVGLFLLAKPILAFVFPTLDFNMLNIASTLLKFSVFEMFFLCFVTVSNSILQALGKSKTPAISLAIGMGLKILLTIILVSNNTFNIYGLTIASTFGYFVASGIAILEIKKQTAFRLGIFEIVLPIIACSVMTAGVLTWLGFFGEDLSFIKLFTCIMLAVIVYFACIFAFRQFKLKDVKNILQIKKN